MTTAVNVSAKVRLTCAFTLLFGSIVVALAATSYSLIHHEVYAKIDEALHIAIGATAMSAEHEFDEHSNQLGGEEDLQSVLNGTHSPFLADTQIMVLQGRRVVAANTGQRLDMQPLPPAEIAVDSTDEGNARIAHEILDLPKFHAKLRICAAKSTRSVAARLARLRRTLLLLLPLGLALAASLGYLVARRALTPLSQLTRTIDHLTSSDMTSRVTLGQSDDEIGQLGARFNALLDRLESAFTMQRRFMADASHELRTPVAVALTAAQAATRPRERQLADCEESLSVVEEQMLRLSRTIQDMFFLSQADSCSLTLQQEPMFLDDVVEEAARAAKTLARAKQQTLRLSLLSEARCMGDQVLLRQAILILLDNAVKYTPPQGTIEIQLERSAGFWICSVTDNGVGIAPTAQPHIFERFYRGNQSNGDQVPGSGLGLSIAKSILEAHAGTLSLSESRPGCTRFSLAVPAFDAEAETLRNQANSLPVRM